MHLQFRSVRADELAERFPVARAGQVDQVRGHGAMVAYGPGPVRPVRGGPGVCSGMATYLFTFCRRRGTRRRLIRSAPGRAGSSSSGRGSRTAATPGFAACSLGARVTDTTLGGYSLIRAGGLDAAVALGRGCPMLADGGAVEICELTSHDGRFDQWLDTMGGRHD